ncbi:hypothetical protein DPEC_G00317430 [Dallia pectoralis]|uniref:Uncharacterized protein n=1 Tax=Dallia pectoralis TaxID=75939 RepID=A0ACC2FD06_DALPE|nr:hypothetical protein DPEC_G00317430 [Dallia pectoralis]
MHPSASCVLFHPSCVDLTRRSQTAWRQAPDVTHSPSGAVSQSPRPASSPLLPTAAVTQMFTSAADPFRFHGNPRPPPTRVDP